MASVGIVGAGLSGLCMAKKLQQAGFHNYTIFEAADDIGGTVSAPAAAYAGIHASPAVLGPLPSSC
jgi:cation diffusion facilitator CzcD-associated flavoprotein CzcO